MSNSFATPWAIARQAPVSMGFPRQGILEWVAISSSRGSSWRRDWTVCLALAGRFFPTEPSWKPKGHLSSGYQVCGGSWVALLSPSQRGLSLHTAAWESLPSLQASFLLLGAHHQFCACAIVLEGRTAGSGFYLF